MEMKVIKVVKKHRSGSSTFVEIIHNETGEDFIEDDFEEFASSICAEDSAGQIYGYTYTWEIVTEPHEILNAVSKRFLDINNEIESLEQEKNEYLTNFPELKPKKSKEAQDVADSLEKFGCSASQYEKTQNFRRNEIIFWESHGNKKMIESSKSLLVFGEEVLSILKDKEKKREEN